MFEQRLKQLEEQRQVLLAEADLHRSTLGLECARWRTRLDSVRTRFRSGPWWLAGAALAGLLAARRWRGLARWALTAFTSWRWMRQWK